MAVTTELADTSATVQPAAGPGSAITPAALLRALARPQVESGRLAFEARMVERARDGAFEPTRPSARSTSSSRV